MARRPRNQQLADAFGQRIRERRIAAGYSQEKLAELSGLHRTYIGHIENGRIMVSLDTVILLAHSLGTTAEELVAQLDQGPAND